MNYAVLLYMNTSNPGGCPDQWPAETIELGEDTTLPNQSWILMTSEELELHKAAHQNSYNTWLAAVRSNAAAEQVQRNVKNKIIDAMVFGQEIIAEYGSQNVLSGKNTEQVQQIMVATSKVQTALLSGSLYVALAEIEALQVDGVLITENTKSYFRNRIQSYLGIPLT